ncbi:MAG: hypothetical protein Q4E83_02390 [bacterium]|nr:hypothetical protein [bacterium]
MFYNNIQYDMFNLYNSRLATGYCDFGIPNFSNMSNSLYFNNYNTNNWNLGIFAEYAPTNSYGGFGAIGGQQIDSIGFGGGVGSISAPGASFINQNKKEEITNEENSTESSTTTATETDTQEKTEDTKESKETKETDDKKSSEEKAEVVDEAKVEEEIQKKVAKDPKKADYVIVQNDEEGKTSYIPITGELTKVEQDTIENSGAQIVSKQAIEKAQKKGHRKVEHSKKLKNMSTKDKIGAGIAGFFNGAVKMVTDTFYPKDENGKFSWKKFGRNMAILGATVAATVLCPGVGTALMYAGLAVGTAMTAKGVVDICKLDGESTQADLEKACETTGQGIITAATCGKGIKSTVKMNGFSAKPVNVGRSTKASAKDLTVGGFKTMVKQFKQTGEEIKILTGKTNTTNKNSKLGQIYKNRHAQYTKNFKENRYEPLEKQIKTKSEELQTEINKIDAELNKHNIDSKTKAILEYKKENLKTIKFSLDKAKTKGGYKAINNEISKIENEINGFKSQFKTDREVTINGEKFNINDKNLLSFKKGIWNHRLFHKNEDELLSFRVWSKELNRQKREFNALTTEKNKVMRKAAYKNYKEDTEMQTKVKEYYPNIIFKNRFDRNWNLKRFYFEDFKIKKLWKKENILPSLGIGLSAYGGGVAEVAMYSPCARFNNTGITSLNRTVSLFADSNYDNGDVYSQEELNGLANACGLEANDIENIDEKEEA